jgi:hypothetical protein
MSGFDMEDPDAGERRLAFMALQSAEYEAWRDAVMAELKRFGVEKINAGGEHERLHDAITYWAETLAQLRMADPDAAHAERALEERRANWERWGT